MAMSLLPKAVGTFPLRRSSTRLFGRCLKERLDSFDNIIVVVYLPDQTPLSKGRWPRGRRRCTGSSIRVATPTQAPTCTARVLPFVCAAACREGPRSRADRLAPDLRQRR